MDAEQIDGLLRQAEQRIKWATEGMRVRGTPQPNALGTIAEAMIAFRNAVVMCEAEWIHLKDHVAKDYEDRSDKATREGRR